MGVVHDGELFVVGRLKELLIIAGANHHPHDIERVGEEAHPSVRPHSSAAFALDERDDSAVGLVLDAEPGEDAELADALGAIRSRVAEHLDVHLALVALCPPGTVPKTTSGKIQRRLCRSLLEAGELDLLALWRRDGDG